MTDRPSEPPAPARGLGRLSRELLAVAAKSPERLAEHFGRLSLIEQAELALRLPAAARAKLLLHSPRPMQLVRALPDSDFYFTVRELGPVDATPLIKVASVSQLHHLVDLEGWRDDRFDADRAGAWVALFLEAGESTLKRFLRNTSDETLALLFQQWIRVRQLEYEDSPEVHGHGLSEEGTEEGAVTPEGYYRFKPTIPEHGPAIRGLLQVFYSDQPERYLQILWSASWELPSELEEQALYWRDSRLEEHGYPTWEEALSIYAPPRSPVPEPTPKGDEPADEIDGLGVGRLGLVEWSGTAPLVEAVDELEPAERERTLQAFTSLANRVLVAARGDTGDLETHRGAVETAAGYLRIGLAGRGAEQAAEIREVVETVPLVELFREGYAKAASLQARAHRLRQRGWASTDADALEMLDSPVRERVTALMGSAGSMDSMDSMDSMGSRPMYVDLSTETASLTERPFRTPREIDEAAAAVEMAEVVGDLLVERLGFELRPYLEGSRASRTDPPRFSALWLTALAWHATRGELGTTPLPRDVVADLLRGVASRRTAAPQAAERALEMLLRTLVKRFALEPREAQVLHAFGRFCLERLADECGALDPGVPLDPRFVTCLLLDADSPV